MRSFVNANSTPVGTGRQAVVTAICHATHVQGKYMYACTSSSLGPGSGVEAAAWATARIQAGPMDAAATPPFARSQEFSAGFVPEFALGCIPRGSNDDDAIGVRTHRLTDLNGY